MTDIWQEYKRQREQEVAAAQAQAKRDALLAMGMSLLGTRKGQELEGLGKAGLLGLATARNTNIPEGPSLRDMLALQQYEQQQKEREAAMAEQQAMRGAATASMIPGQPGAPEMGPPTPAGAMQPAVAPTPSRFDRNAYVQRLYSMGRVNEAMAVEKLAQQESPFDKPKPENWTPESLAQYAQTRDPSVLKRYEAPKEPASPVGKVNPADFTPASVDAFLKSGGTNYGVLQQVPKPSTTVNVAAPRIPPPPQFMWNKEGTAVVPIPGSPAAREVAMEAERGKAALDDAIASTQRVRQGINEVRTMISPMTSGMGSLLTYKPGSQARDLQSKLTNIKSVVALQSLQALKEASKQGASGFGALSEKELTVIESKIANIDQATSGPALKAAVDAVDQEFERLEKRAIRARAAAVIGGK